MSGVIVCDVIISNLCSSVLLTVLWSAPFVKERNYFVFSGFSTLLVYYCFQDLASSIL